MKLLLIVFLGILLHGTEATGTMEEATNPIAATAAAVTLSAFAMWLKTATKKDDTCAAELESKLHIEEITSVEVRILLFSLHCSTVQVNMQLKTNVCVFPIVPIRD